MYNKFGVECAAFCRRLSRYNLGVLRGQSLVDFCSRMFAALWADCCRRCAVCICAATVREEL